MKIFGFNISIHREATETKDATQYPLSAAVWPDEVRAGAVLSNAYQQVVWVYRAINALAEQVSNIPFRFSTTSSQGEQLMAISPRDTAPL